MKKNSLDLIKELRAETKAGVMDCRKALAESAGDFKKAKEWLRKKGIASAQKRTERETTAGLVEAYTHPDGRIAAIVELACETDFVARNEEFKKLAHELALQVAAMDPSNIKALEAQPYIRDPQKTIGELVKETIGKIGENIVIRKILRAELGLS